MRPFLEHPASVDETYTEHLVSSWSFALRLLAAGGACLVHGVFPFLCVRTGSNAVRALHREMVTDRVSAKSDSPPGSY